MNLKKTDWEALDNRADNWADNPADNQADNQADDVNDKYCIKPMIWTW